MRTDRRWRSHVLLGRGRANGQPQGSPHTRAPFLREGQSRCQVPHHPREPHTFLPSSSSRSQHQPARSTSHLDRGKPFLLLVSASPSLSRSSICLRPNGPCFLSHLSCPPFPSSNSCFSKRARPPCPYIQLLVFTPTGQVVALLCSRPSLAAVSLFP